MNNFTYYNPVKIIFGKKSIGKINKLIPAESKVLLLYGKGSIKKNGVYEQVVSGLSEHQFIEFGGIEANPEYETLLKAVEICRKEDIGFLLAVGGGSVLDGSKFIAAARFAEGEPWESVVKGRQISQALPIGCILTLAATGSEANGYSVVSYRKKGEKLSFGSSLLYPQFSVLDPETTFSLPEVQSINGVVDAFIHVMEQYLTFPAGAALQDRQAEALLKTLIEEGPKLKSNPDDYTLRANLMWAASNALNGLIGCGVAQDWSTHIIGHELTARYGLDHGRSLAVIWPALVRHQKEQKFKKMVQYGKRVWHILKDEESIFNEVLKRTVGFFESLGVASSLAAYGVEQGDFNDIAEAIEKRGLKLGEHKNIGKEEILEILNLSLKGNY